MDWRTDFYEARWHLDVTVRMLGIYDEYAEKRILIGVIREAAKCAGNLVRAFLIMDNTHGNLKTFTEKVAVKYLDAKSAEDLVMVLKIERAQRLSRVEFARKDAILLEDAGKWKVLKISRLRELVKNINNIVDNFPTGIKR
jgi:hypothetical protein